MRPQNTRKLDQLASPLASSPDEIGRSTCAVPLTVARSTQESNIRSRQPQPPVTSKDQTMTAATATAPVGVPLASRHAGESAVGDPAPSQRKICYAALEMADAIVTAHPGAGQSVWQALVPAAAEAQTGLGRSARPHAVAATRLILRALPPTAQTAHAGYRAAAKMLTGALADTVAAQAKYPCLPVKAGDRTFAVELHPATCDGGADGPWLNGRILAHLFRATIGNPGGRTLGRHAGVIVLCWRSLAASEHRGGVGRHYLGSCTTCEPFAAALGLLADDELDVDATQTGPAAAAGAER